VVFLHLWVEILTCKPNGGIKMPSFVITEKCDGCKGGDKTACMYICPNDLMVLDPNAMKAYNQEPDQCWECFSCVKICPTQAIEVRGYSDFVPLGSSIMPMMGTEDVMWTCKFRNGLSNDSSSLSAPPLKEKRTLIPV
jgi:adenylylsulfate reductase, subunit B